MQLELDKDTARAAISGEFTFADHGTFKQMMAALFCSKSAPIVIDVSRLDFIDSAGLGMLLLVRDEAGKAERKLILKGPRGQVKRMFDVTKFENLFAIEA